MFQTDYIPDLVKFFFGRFAIFLPSKKLDCFVDFFILL